MDTKMTHTARAELANAIRRRYRSAAGKEKSRIQEGTRPFADEIERLDAIPGVNHQVAEVLLAEVGPDT